MMPSPTSGWPSFADSPATRRSHAIASSHREPDRYSMSEIKWVATLPVKNLQKRAEDLAKNIRELNALIQETNWKSELP